MVAETEVVVGGEIDDALSVVGAERCLLIIEFAQFEEGSTLTQIVELGSEVGELGTFGGRCGHGKYRKPWAVRVVFGAKSASYNLGVSDAQTRVTGHETRT